MSTFLAEQVDRADIPDDDERALLRAIAEKADDCGYFDAEHQALKLASGLGLLRYARAFNAIKHRDDIRFTGGVRRIGVEVWVLQRGDLDL